MGTRSSSADAPNEASNTGEASSADLTQSHESQSAQQRASHPNYQALACLKGQLVRQEDRLMLRIQDRLIRISAVEAREAYKLLVDGESAFETDNFWMLYPRTSDGILSKCMLLSRGQKAIEANSLRISGYVKEASAKQLTIAIGKNPDSGKRTFKSFSIQLTLDIPLPGIKVGEMWGFDCKLDDELQLVVSKSWRKRDALPAVRKKSQASQSKTPDEN